MDAPGPWGTGPFTLTEGHSSIETITAIQQVRPQFVATNIITAEDRSPRVVLEANTDHNTERTARLARVIFRNDLTAAEALDAVCDREGEMDIVTELAPGDAERVRASSHAELVTIDANRVLVGIFNMWPDRGAPLDDRHAREAINLAVDRDRLCSDVLCGFATPLASLTPSWENGCFPDAEPRKRDPERARALLSEAAWPDGRGLVMATPASLAGIAEAVADDLRQAGLDVEVIDVPDEGLIAGTRMLIEKKLVPPWDVLLHAWFDLSSDLPPAVLHREFFGRDGAFRAGPPIPEFDRMFAGLLTRIDPEEARRAAEAIDKWAFDEAAVLALCAPQALYAVNRHVNFQAYRTTFELADTEVSSEHWSRRDGA
ncbi:MAG: ABC transporter substrate-binding protein [Solirubrobacterales bacterium]|nr:ABC transporter substrate-binding protein [Solirubrobacterales bacterium]